MTEFKVDNYVDQTIKELQAASNYTANDIERDELRITGRMCISLTSFAPFLKQTQSFLRSHSNAIWQLSFNVVSCDVEISLKNTLISL